MTMGRVRHGNLQILEASGLGIQEGHRLIAIEGIEMPGASTVAVEHCCAASTYRFDVLGDVAQTSVHQKNGATSIDVFLTENPAYS